MTKRSVAGTDPTLAAVRAHHAPGQAARGRPADSCRRRRLDAHVREAPCAARRVRLQLPGPAQRFAPRAGPRSTRPAEQHSREGRPGPTRPRASGRRAALERGRARAPRRSRPSLATPSLGVEACAYRRRGIRPARRACQPASTASRMAPAIATGSSARETALASSTPSQPSSIAIAASEAVPMPASRITGTVGGLDDQPQVVGVADPHAAADRRAERHHRRAARVLQAAREDGVVVRVGQHHEAVVHERLGGVEQLDRVGQERAVVADHLELHPVGLERLAARAGRW